MCVHSESISHSAKFVIMTHASESRFCEIKRKKVTARRLHLKPKMIFILFEIYINVSVPTLLICLSFEIHSFVRANKNSLSHTLFVLGCENNFFFIFYPVSHLRLEKLLLICV